MQIETKKKKKLLNEPCKFYCFVKKNDRILGMKLIVYAAHSGNKINSFTKCACEIQFEAEKKKTEANQMNTEETH